MLKHLPAILAGLLGAAIPAGLAVYYKPAPVIVQPQTTIIAKTTRGTASPVAQGVPPGDVLSRAEQRELDAMWGDLAQKEIDDLTAALKTLPKTEVVIFCGDDKRCGDMQLDLDNAFESDHWQTRLEKPMIDNTVGIVTTRQDLRDALNQATSSRLDVQVAPRNAPWDYVTIGSKSTRGSSAR